jgi:hypothetical protein
MVDCLYLLSSLTPSDGAHGGDDLAQQIPDVLAFPDLVVSEKDHNSVDALSLSLSLISHLFASATA